MKGGNLGTPLTCHDGVGDIGQGGLLAGDEEAESGGEGYGKAGVGVVHVTDDLEVCTKLWG